MAKKEKQSHAIGSPEWWMGRSRPSPGKRARPGRPSVPVDRIIAAALEAVDSVGTEAFNMRLLAERLESGTATLYRHFASKAEILVCVVDQVLGELKFDEAAFRGMPWQQALRSAAEGLYRALDAHPNVVPLLVSQVPVGPNGLRARELGVGVLLANGFSPPLAARAYTTVAHYVIGFAVQKHASGVPESTESAELRRFYRKLDPKAYPATIKAAEHLPGTSVDDEFSFGLTLIIEGLDRVRRSLRQDAKAGQGPIRPPSGSSALKRSAAQRGHVR